nr:CPPV286 hypothetical protein [Cooks petrelpox virus]
MISLPSSCQNIVNTVIHGKCFFGRCSNKRLKITVPMTSSELEYIQEWMLEKHDLFIEFPIDLMTMEHIMMHLATDITTIKRKKSDVTAYRTRLKDVPEAD